MPDGYRRSRKTMQVRATKLEEIPFAPGQGEMNTLAMTCANVCEPRARLEFSVRRPYKASSLSTPLPLTNANESGAEPHDERSPSTVGFVLGMRSVSVGAAGILLKLLACCCVDVIWA